MAISRSKVSAEVLNYRPFLITGEVKKAADILIATA